MKQPITDKHLEKLQMILPEDKLTRDPFHPEFVNFRDMQFSDFIRAARYLQFIRDTEYPESFTNLIG